MTSFNVWDLVKVPFPYTDRSTRQRRPALVVGRPDGTEGPELLWVLMVTSAAHRGWPGDVAVSDLEAAGLPAASLVRTSKIATIEARETEQIGRLPAQDRPLVADALQGVLGPVLAG